MKEAKKKGKNLAEVVSALSGMVRGGLVAMGTGTHANDAQGMPLTQSATGQSVHRFAACRCLYHFFRSTSCTASFSSIDSASSFFRRVFSLSSSFSRFASGTLMPHKLVVPQVVARFRESVPSAQFLDWQTTVSFPRESNNLFFGEALLDVQSPSW